MMVRSFYVFILFCCYGVGYGKWKPATEEELIVWADVIVVAEFGSLKQDDGKSYGNQEATFLVKKVIKGEADSEVRVKGSSRFLCAPVIRFSGQEKGEYLLFLKGEKNALLVPVSGPSSMLSIKEGRVKWFGEEEGSWAMLELKSLEEVIALIQGVLRRGEKGEKVN